MKRTKLSVLLSLAALAMFLTLGCGDDDSKPDKPADKGGTPTTAPAPTGGGAPAPAPAEIDYTDADSVAKAFVQALAAKDKDKALALIHEDNRAELKRDLEKEFPPVPADPKVSVKVTEEGGVKTGKFEGNVRSIRNLGMKFEDGKWWVVD